MAKRHSASLDERQGTADILDSLRSLVGVFKATCSLCMYDGGSRDKHTNVLTNSQALRAAHAGKAVQRWQDLRVVLESHTRHGHPRWSVARSSAALQELTRSTQRGCARRL